MGWGWGYSSIGLVLNSDDSISELIHLNEPIFRLGFHYSNHCPTTGTSKTVACAVQSVGKQLVNCSLVLTEK